MDGVYLNGINQTALLMHPAIHMFDQDLRSSSESLANITADYEAPIVEPDFVDNLFESAPYDEALFLKLKQWRLDKAKEDKVSAFIIAHNTLLEELARRKPQTAQALLGVKGFGQNKLDKYGDELLEILQATS